MPSNAALPKKILFFGNEQLATGVKAKPFIFEALLSSPYQILGLILPTQPPRQPFPIAKLATKHDIPIFYGKDKQALLRIIKQSQATLGILASYGKIIPSEILSALPLGIVNIHPSLLPQYRGTSPIETAILDGKKTTGDSLMQLSSVMDAGPILAQRAIGLPPTFSKQSLYESLSALGAKLLIATLPALFAGTAEPKAQIEAQATFTKPLTKDLGFLNPRAHSAHELALAVIAFQGFPKPKLKLLGLDCIITKAHASKTPASSLDPICKDGNFLVIDTLIPPNRKNMSSRDFLNGFRPSKSVPFAP